MVTSVSAFEIRETLEKLGDLEKKETLLRFFKTGKGEYGEGDLFLGVTVPMIRKVAKCYINVKEEVVLELLSSSYHECRLCALLIWVARFRKASLEEQALIYTDYLAHTRFINNWDLVDLSAPSIVGGSLLKRMEEAKEQLKALASRESLWDQRIAVVATYAFIREGCFEYTLVLSEYHLHHPHDLMQKAIGWMLREVGKRDKGVLLAFLDLHHKEMPRTMLRYAIEKFSLEERTYYMRR